MVPGGQFAMTTGTIQMLLSSAACWATLGEQPFTVWELVSSQSAPSFLEGPVWAFSPWWGVDTLSLVSSDSV